MAAHPLSLFPLQVVLLPEEHLPLHIFEERYKQMIGECLAEESPFGVVLMERRGIRKVGCTARIVQLLEKFPDGRMNILTQGERRFRIIRTYQDRPYLLGEVDYFDDAPEEEPPPELARRVLDALGAEGEDALSLPEGVREDPQRLSFAMGAALRIPLQEKQALLECTSARERLGRLLRILEDKERRSALLARHQRVAGRNGRP